MNYKVYNLINARPRVKIRVENLPAGYIPARPRFTSVPVDVLFSDISEKAAADYVMVEKMRGEQDADYVLSINSRRRIDRDYDRGRFTVMIDYQQDIWTLFAHNAERLYYPNSEETAQGFRVGVNSRRAREYAADYAASFSYDVGGDWNYDDERV